MRMRQIVHDTVVLFDDISSYNELGANEELYLTIGQGKRAYLIIPGIDIGPAVDPFPPTDPMSPIDIKVRPVLQTGDGAAPERFSSGQTRVEVVPQSSEVIAPILLTPWTDHAPYEVQISVSSPYPKGELTNFHFFVVVGEI